MTAAGPRIVGEGWRPGKTGTTASCYAGPMRELPVHRGSAPAGPACGHPGKATGHRTRTARQLARDRATARATGSGRRTAPPRRQRHASTCRTGAGYRRDLIGHSVLLARSWTPARHPIRATASAGPRDRGRKSRDHGVRDRTVRPRAAVRDRRAREQAGRTRPAAQAQQVRACKVPDRPARACTRPHQPARACTAPRRPVRG
jgi:hypothetical protein